MAKVEALYRVWQCQINKSWPNLQQWKVIETYDNLPRDIDPEESDESHIYSVLEDEFCSEVCLHQFKITPPKTHVKNAIFNSKEMR